MTYRSKFEGRVAKQIGNNLEFVAYENMKIPYVQPAKNRNYIPDFPLPNGIILEAKGRFTVEDRRKHLLIREQHPELDIRFVFMNAKVKIRKGSKTTYAMWCRKHGFKFCEKIIPQSWFKGC